MMGSLDTDTAMSYENFISLHRRQTKLRNVFAGPWMQPPHWSVLGPHKRPSGPMHKYDAKLITSVTIYLSMSANAFMTSMAEFLPRLLRLNILEMIASSDCHQDGGNITNFFANIRPTNDMLNTLLQYVGTNKAGSRAARLRPRFLNICGLNLTNAALIFAEAIEMHRVENLTMQNCVGYQTVLVLLTDHNARLKDAPSALRSLAVTDSPFGTALPDPNLVTQDEGISNFLDSFTGLERFVYVGYQPLRPLGFVKNLAQHKDTLKYLYLDDLPNHAGFDVSVVKPVLAQLSGIQQLGVSLDVTQRPIFGFKLHAEEICDRLVRH